MAKFRTKPIEVEAMQFDGTKASFDRIYDWMDGDHPKSAMSGYNGPDEDHPESFGIIRSDGHRTTVYPGEWVIKDNDRGFEDCHPVRFAREYEPVGESSKRWYFIQTHRDVVFGDEAELRAKVKAAGLAAFAAGGSDHPPLIEDQGPDVLNTVIAAPSELVDASNPQAAEVLAALFVDGVLGERIKALDSRGHAH